MPDALLQTAPPAPQAAAPGRVLSPLTGAPTVRVLRKMQCAPLMAAWRTHYAIELGPDFDRRREFALYECLDTGLQFFQPPELAGTAELYAQLGRFDWYYDPHRWEHDVALADLAGARRVLEVGCGSGAFVARLRQHGLAAEGLELNPAAAAAARQNGLPVHREDLLDWADQQRGTYDAVCAFQVLEHVPHVGDFLRAMIDLLAPGGRLLLSVPNQESFLGGRDVLLDLPPHHMTRWQPAVLHKLPNLFPLALRRMALEPLQACHVDCWALACAGRSRLRRFAVRSIARPLLAHSAWLRARLRGQTVFACFEKTLTTR